jgi:GTP cyclohydrolase IA
MPFMNQSRDDKTTNRTTQGILAKVRPTPVVENSLSRDEKIQIISKSFKEIMGALGLDLKNDSLKETPNRIAKMYVDEIFSGLDEDHFPKVTAIQNEMNYDQMVLIQNIDVFSVCEHHFQTIEGVATVAYIPKKSVIGLSKVNRIVQFFSRRPQVQERLTKQIADCLEAILETDNVAVHINAKHFCVAARGIQDGHSRTSTSDLRGSFKAIAETRLEFLQHCKTTSA